jgi:hypothetical protein
MLVSCLAYSSTYFSETSVTLQHATQLYNPEARTLYKQQRENLKSNIIQRVYNNSSTQTPISAISLPVAKAEK